MQPPHNLAPALDLYRRGDLAGARREAEAALAKAPDDAALLGFAGLVAAQTGDFPRAIGHLGRALEAMPDDLATRINLAMTLVSAGQLDEAARVCAAGRGDPKLARLGAYVDQQRGRLDEAAAGYRVVLEAVPNDFESWNNLGNVLAVKGDVDEAIDAFQRAIRLRPDILEMVMNLSEVLAKADRPEQRAAMMREAARVSPDDPKVQTELGLAESAVPDFAAAEQAFRTAIRLDSRNTAAFLELGLLLENLNRIDDLAALAEEADRNGLTGPEINFLQAWALRRRGRFAEALALAEAVPETVNPIRRAQLLAELYDRAGEEPRAFAAFTEMNREAARARPAQPGPTYREQIAGNAAAMTPERIAAWTRFGVAPTPPAPIFIVGFPRSGTTLLDTLLMNVPNLHVLEELPILREVEAAIPPDGDLGLMTGEEARLLRDRYFEVLERQAPAPPGTRVVDKHPLHMARMPLIHRIFPDAKVILVERHPCDAVLSCFMANFQLNQAMRSFTDLEEAARTYDSVFEMWTRATTLLPVDVHRARYERMVEDLEAEMRALLDFLGLPWEPKVLDNQAAAAGRGHVRTASYSQVAEPIYKRAAGRWRRYREQMAPVLPILAPWAERMDYGM